MEPMLSSPGTMPEGSKESSFRLIRLIPAFALAVSHGAGVQLTPSDVVKFVWTSRTWVAYAS